MPILLVDVTLPSAGIAGPDLTRYFLVCGGLLALVGVLAFFARRGLGSHMRRRAQKRSLQVVDVLPLGGKQKLCVVRCYDRTFLLGLGDREVRSIAELDSDGVLAPASPEPSAEALPEPRPSSSFDQRLVEELEQPHPVRIRRESAAWSDGEGVLG